MHARDNLKEESSLGERKMSSSTAIRDGPPSARAGGKQPSLKKEKDRGWRVARRKKRKGLG